MATTQIKLGVRIAWWLRWYLSGVALMCWMTKCPPDMGKVAYWAGRAIKLRIIK